MVLTDVSWMFTLGTTYACTKSLTVSLPLAEPTAPAFSYRTAFIAVKVPSFVPANVT